MPGCGGNCACAPTATAVEKIDTTPVNVTIEDEKLKHLLDKYFNNESEQDDREGQQKEIFRRYKDLYKKDTLVRVVETLGFALTDTNVEKRAKGTGLLAECIFQCAPGSLDDTEVDILMRFFCDRLKDHHSIQPLVIYAFLAMSSYQNVRNDQIISMLQSIFTEVHIQSLLQADRRNVFNIFSNLLTTKLHVLETINADFVFGFIQAMDSERDPRNLLLCFDNSLRIILSLDIKLFAEDFFEILSCYFPVDFRERAEEEFRIKKKDLVSALHKCLSATSLFGPYAVPLYLEKLSSDLAEAKLDALLTFTACLQVYKPEDIALHIDDIWLAVRKDYLLSDFAELGDAYLVFVYELVISISRLEDGSCIKKLVDFVVKDSLQTLKDPEMVIAKPCANVIYRISQASSSAFSEIIERLITPLQTALEKYTSVAQRTNVMEIVSAVLSVDLRSQWRTESSRKLLIDFVHYLLPLIYGSLANTDGVQLKILCLKCLEEVICKRTHYPEIDYDALSIHALSALNADVPLNLLTGFQTFISKLTLHQPQSFLKNCLPLLEEKSSRRKKMINLLPYASFEDRELQEEGYKHLNDLLQKACQENAVDEGVEVLKCYQCVLQRSTDSVPGHLIFDSLYSIIASKDTPEALVLKGSDLLAVCVHALSEADRTKVSGFVSQLLVSEGSCEPETLFSSLLPSLHVGDDYLRLSIVVKGLLTQVETKSLQTDLDNICNKLMKLLKQSSDARVHQNLAITLASIVNKLPATTQHAQPYLDALKESVRNGTADNRDVVLLGWLTKSLVLSWQSSTTAAIDLMLECLSIPSLAMQCSDNFGVIVKDCEFVFTKKSHAVVRPVYKQRYTEYIVPLLIAQYNTCPEQHKCFHMVALSTTLGAIPSRMVQKHMKSMMPLLMHSLTTCTTQQQVEQKQQKHQQESQQQEQQQQPQQPEQSQQQEQQQQIVESTLKTICTVVNQSRDDILDYVPTLISHLGKLTCNSSMNNRISALKSLTVLSTYTVHVILPLRNEVLKRTQAVLDDGKRLVRKEAVRCSNAWHLLNSA